MADFSTDEYTFDYENDESYPETLREKLYDKGLGKLYIMRNIPFWSDALEATPYHANINAGAAAFYRVEGGHKYEPDINYLHNGKYKDMKGDKKLLRDVELSIKQGRKNKSFPY